MTECNEKVSEISDIVYDVENGNIYSIGKFYGKGAFAKCYELINESGHVFAGKIVSKKILIKAKNREKMTQEIEIHKELKHFNVVNYCGFFEDSQNMYILLELCRKRSMMELNNRRGTITEPETRYYMNQILCGVDYLHRNRIIHRDLKLGNLFLTDDLVVKIGDFGLATRVKFQGERKKSLCGTPNYTAPEIIMKNGHSYKVDVWSIGCIMYTLLIGKPPFESKTINETYTRIKKCEYQKPSQRYVSEDAIAMIEAMLQYDPINRPNVNQLMMFSFISNGYLPSSLPVTSLTTAPRFDHLEYIRQPLIELNNGSGKVAQTAVSAPRAPADNVFVIDNTNPELCKSVNVNTNHEVDDLLINLIEQLNDLLFKNELKTNEKLGVESSDPEAHPIVWISKWVDYTDKYGFGYQLSDDCVGVIFNDKTKLILLSNGINVHYIEGQTETYMTITQYPQSLHKKILLLSYFVNYMRDRLRKTGSNRATTDSDHMARVPYLNSWCRTSCAVTFRLTNGLVQINFNDHNKIIICPRMKAVTLINAKQLFTTYRFATLKKQGCPEILSEYMFYAYAKMKTLV